MNENVERIKQRYEREKDKNSIGKLVLRFFLMLAAGIAVAAGLCVLLLKVKADMDTASPVNLSQTEAVTETMPEVITVETNDVTEPVTEVTEAVTETTRAEVEFNGTSAYIAMDNLCQNPELPTGCEITSLTMVLNFLGYDVDKSVMADSYLPSTNGNFSQIDGVKYGDSFKKYFIGDPHTNRAYGCFAPAITTAAEKYIKENNGRHTVHNISGAPAETLFEYVAKGVPVVCWGTNGLIEPTYYDSWIDNESGEKLDWYLNEHCFVLVGFDKDENRVTINDPIKGIRDFNMEKFILRYNQMGNNAVVIMDMNNDIVEFTTTTTAMTEQTTE